MQRSICTTTRLRIIRSARGVLPRGFSSATTDTTRLFDEEINLIYDGKCNLCLKEMKFLNRMDKYGKVMLTDIEDPSYDSNLPQNQGVTYESGMKVMHAILPDGTVIQGIDCFVKVYDIVGLGWVFSVAKVPVLRPMIDKAYDIWAGYRTLVTRGQNLDQIFIDKREQEINSKLDSITEEDCERCNDVSLPKRE